MHILLSLHTQPFLKFPTIENDKILFTKVVFSFLLSNRRDLHALETFPHADTQGINRRSRGPNQNAQPAQLGLDKHVGLHHAFGLGHHCRHWPPHLHLRM